MLHQVSTIELAATFFGGAVFAVCASSASVQLSELGRKLRSLCWKVKTTPAIVTAATITGVRANVFTREEVTATFAVGTWQRKTFDDFSTILLDDQLIFPCIYATKGYQSSQQLYLFIDSDDLSDPRHSRALAHALAYYLPRSHKLGPNTSLVLLAKENEDPRSIEEYNASFWDLLNGLAGHDSVSWPEDVPRDIDTDKWCFCFGGEPFFTVVQTPAHDRRLSRYMKGLTIVFQPKWIFDVLFSSEDKKKGVMDKIRGLLKKYDLVSVSPELKNYGEDGSREATQYFLLDENVPAKCPFTKLPE